MSARPGFIERICLSVNSICNLACRYCYFHAHPDALPGPAALTAAEIGTILSRIRQHADQHPDGKLIKVNFVGSGEPLLHWPAIRQAVAAYYETRPDQRLRFYTVTNGTLLTRTILREMQELDLTPSVSLDGPRELHDRYRCGPDGRGTFDRVMRTLELLREAGLPVILNTTLTAELAEQLERYLDFVTDERVDKVIFDRLVDAPTGIRAVTPREFYRALQRITQLLATRSPAGPEIGNLAAYRRLLRGAPDQVCTMFGSSCGAGRTNLTYLQRDVYPCGRMFRDPDWRLGAFDEALELFPGRMAQRQFQFDQEAGAAADQQEGECLLDRGSRTARSAWIAWLQRQEE